MTPDFATKLRRYLAVGPFAQAAIVLIGILLAAIIFWHQLGGRPTYGKIWVGSPEIYTRERLVNDRFLQDAWLNQQLATNAKSTVQQIVEERRSTKVRVGAAAPKKKPETENSVGSSQPRSDTTSPEASRDLLTDQIDFRDQVRNLLIENQLDDRHDLNGNALYRMKFDATIVPGDRTLGLAEIHVSLHGPDLSISKNAPETRDNAKELGTPEQIEQWRDMYTKWLENLRTRLNQTHKELKQAFTNNEFSHNDYARFISFLSTNLNLDARRLARCPSSVADVRGPSGNTPQLRPQDHALRKLCIDSVVEASLRDSPQQPPSFGPPLPAGSYIYQCPLPGPTSSAGQSVGANDRPQATRLQTGSPRENTSARSQEVARKVDFWLNAFVASKSIQLVLGIPVPEATFVGHQFSIVPALQPLIRLTFFNPQFETGYGNVFNVAQKTFTVAAIDQSKLSQGTLSELNCSLEAFRGKTPDDFREAQKGGFRKGFMISQFDQAAIDEEGYSLLPSDFNLIRDGVYAARVEVGLLNFARKARQHVSAFTYAVTPKESSDNTLLTASVDSQIAGGASSFGPKGAEIDLLSAAGSTARALNRRGTAVGFGSSTSEENSAEFGWVIGPRRLIAKSTNLEFIHAPAQYSLSALVSVPSWWNKVKLEVTTDWVDPDGLRKAKTTEKAEYSVDLPNDFEPLEALLLEVQQLGPELMESRLDPVLLTACSGGAIVIPGKRLWRSTVVTLGYQVADQIAVLPDMKGIIARFFSVENQASPNEEASWHAGHPAAREVEIERPVRVWTSQGAIALPSPARIGIPAGCVPKEGASPKRL